MLHFESSSFPDWAGIACGSDDMASAYRQLPNRPSESQGLVIAWYDTVTESPLFAVLRAHPYGLGSAVLNFNRARGLTSAVSRRCFGAAVTHYFDDSGVDWASASGSAQEAVIEVHDAVGITLDANKRQPMGVQRIFLGVLLDLALFAQGEIRFDVKPELRQALQQEVDSLLLSGECTASQAAKLRGRFGWASTAAFGKCARGGCHALIQRQYAETDVAIHHVLPRSIPLARRVSPVRVLYTDASWEPHDMESPGLGAVLLGRGTQPTYGLAASVPPCVLASFLSRDTQIAPLEGLAVLQAFAILADSLRGQDVLLFVDNTSICSALVKGSSSAAGIALVLRSSFPVGILAVPSVHPDSNVSDGLSQDGIQDQWTVSQSWELVEASCAPWQAICEKGTACAWKALLHWGSLQAVTLGVSVQPGRDICGLD